MRVKKQISINECGLYVLEGLIWKFQKQKVEIKELRAHANLTDNGMSAFELIRVAKIYGLNLKGYEGSLDMIVKNKVNDYLVAIINNEQFLHYVVVKILKDKIIVWDSQSGKRQMTIEQFQAIFNNAFFTIGNSKSKQNWSSITNLGQYFLKNFKLSFVILIFSIILIALIITSSFYLRIILDNVLQNFTNKTLVLMTVLFVYLALMRAIIGFFKNYFIQKLERIIFLDLYFASLQKITNASILELKKFSLSDKLGRINMLTEISGFLANGLNLIISEAILFAISTSIMIWISVKLFSLYFSISMFLIVINFVFRYVLNQNYEKNNLLVFKNANNWVNLLSSHEVIKHKNFYPILLSNLNEGTTNLLRNQKNFLGIKNMQRLLLEIVNLTLPILLTYLAITLVFKNELKIGQLFMFLSISQFFLNPFSTLTEITMLYPRYIKSTNLLKNILELSDEEVNEEGLKLDHLQKIELCNLNFAYDKPVLRIKQLIINRSIKISGPNTSGKSTLLKIIAAYYRAEGSLKINELNLDFYDISNYRQKVLYISSNTFVPNMTIKTYLTNEDHLSVEKFNSNILKHKLDEILTLSNLSLDTLMENNAQNLSAGQRQLVLLLKFFANDYQLLLLDEGLENIDSNIYEFLKKIFQKFGNLIIIEVSHSKKYLLDESEEIKIENINQLQSN